MRKLTPKPILLFLLIGQFVTLSIVRFAFAQSEDAFSLSVFPPVLEINADPPAKVESVLNISNLSENEEALKIIFKSFKLSEKADGTITYLTGNSIEGPDPLILQKVKIFEGETPIDRLTLLPLQTKELKLKITLEEGAPIGDYYFSVIFVSGAKPSPEGSQAQVPGGIGTNVILSVGKKGETRGEIKEFSVPSFLSAGPLPITLLLRNNSNHYIVPQGKVIIKNVFGTSVGRIDILPQYILSNSQRYLIDANQASPSANLANSMAKLSGKNRVIIWPEKFLFGLYSANLDVKLSDDGPKFTTSTYFFALPLYVLFAASFFAFVLLGIWLKVKRRI